jgi:hypothetical protein
MRNMSFSLTTEQMYADTKYVTRRLGWDFLKPGDVVCAIEKGQGLKKGEKVKRISLIEIIRVRKECLLDIVSDPDDVKREGFPHMSVFHFIDMFMQANGCPSSQMVNRIEFKRIQWCKE